MAARQSKHEISRSLHESRTEVAFGTGPQTQGALLGEVGARASRRARNEVSRPNNSDHRSAHSAKTARTGNEMRRVSRASIASSLASTANDYNVTRLALYYTLRPALSGCLERAFVFAREASLPHTVTHSTVIVMRQQLMRP